MGMLIKILYLLSSRLAPPLKIAPHPPAKRPYTNSVALWSDVLEACERHGISMRPYPPE